MPAHPPSAEPRQARGWLFDLYAQGGQMVLWFVLEDETRLRLVRDFSPSFFVSAAELSQAGHAADFLHAVAQIDGLHSCGETERLDFWTGQPRAVLAIQFSDLDNAYANIQRLYRRWPGLTYFNCDIPPEIHFCYEHALFPTAECEIVYRGDELLGCATHEDPLSTDYATPPIRSVELRATGVRLHPRPRIDSLSLKDGSSMQVWEDGPPEEILASFNAALRELDPDLIWTDGGDALLFPALFALARQHEIALALDREPGIERRLQFDGRSYPSYGRVLYTAPDYPLFGRWHIDRQNSFWSVETGLEGIVEVARLAHTPVQRTARRSSGTGISSIQLGLAYREYLIPWKKAQPEAWKSALMLLQADRGGLVYQPITGVYEDVYELDFVSMFPSIMARHNVSPETVQCTCCGDDPDVPRVPGIGYCLCRKREGLVSRAVGPLVAKRCTYKRMMAADEVRDELKAQWDQRQKALKWLLVTCFGYLGYRNARFGRIEAHESTCAFSREKLLTAKALCEARGFEMLHAIVDCVWVRKPGASEAEVQTLLRDISQETHVDIALEGHYSWLVFLPSRQNPAAPVPNRYFGRMSGGKLKFRGIECRRGDQAPFVQHFQLELLDMLADADSIERCRALRGKTRDMVSHALDRLRCGDVPLEQLLLRRHLSMNPEDYRGPGMTAIAARQALRCGMRLHAGEAVCFLVTSARDRDPDSRVRLAPLLRAEDTCDVEFYCEQLRRAAATVLEDLLGANLAQIMEEPAQPSRSRAPSRKKQSQQYDPDREQLDWLQPNSEFAAP